MKNLLFVIATSKKLNFFYSWKTKLDILFFSSLKPTVFYLFFNVFFLNQKTKNHIKIFFNTFKNLKIFVNTTNVSKNFLITSGILVKLFKMTSKLFKKSIKMLNLAFNLLFFKITLQSCLFFFFSSPSYIFLKFFTQFIRNSKPFIFLININLLKNFSLYGLKKQKSIKKRIKKRSIKYNFYL